VCGIKRKKKRGAHTDFLRNQILFTMVQSRRDADPDHHLGTAVLGAYADMKDQGYSISIPRLEGIYKSHRKLVKRNKWGCWIPRAGVYFPRRSDAFYSVPTVVS
jgi:hypothetical protein